MSSALQPRHRWTYSDLVALPDDQLRHELIDGEHVDSPLFPGLKLRLRDVFRSARDRAAARRR